MKIKNNYKDVLETKTNFIILIRVRAAAVGQHILCSGSRLWRFLVKTGIIAAIRAGLLPSGLYSLLWLGHHLEKFIQRT
jgi:hypothetical protein